MKRRITFIVVMFICICAFITGCRENKAGKQEQTHMWKFLEAQELSGFVNHSTIYPYHSSEKREMFLRNTFPQVQKGMTVEEVIHLLGKPDQKTRINASENPLAPRMVYEYVYFIFKIERTPNTDDKYIDIAFNDDGKVEWVIGPSSE